MTDSTVNAPARPRRRLLPGGRKSLPLGPPMKPGEDPRSYLIDPEAADLHTGRLLWRPRGVLRLLAYVGLITVSLPIQIVLLATSRSGARDFPFLLHKLICRILGLEVIAHGAPVRDRATLFVGNHSSYLDIKVLGSLIPGSFVAKSEVSRWPVFGVLSKLQRTVFVDRRRQNAGAHASEMERRIKQGDNLILFPEGTSNDGNRVLPFKSALFAVAGLRDSADRPLTVQPVSIAYTRLDGLPLVRSLRPFYAWYGEMELAPHLWDVVSLGHATVEVIFHAPVTIEAFGSRKALARYCEERVAAGVAAGIAHRIEDLDLGPVANAGKAMP